MLRRAAAALKAIPGLLAVLLAPRAFAQSPPAAPTSVALGDFQLRPSLELRTRAEYRRDPPDFGGFDGYGRLSPRVRNAWTFAERSRLGLGVDYGASVRGHFTLQDARALGSAATASLGDPPRVPSRLGPYEAFVEVHSRAARPSSVRLGRQAVIWGEGRLLGNADFSPTGRSLDAARGQLVAGSYDLEVLAALLEAPTPLGASFGDRTGPGVSGTQLYGLAARATWDPLLVLELFALARIARSPGVDLDGSRFALARTSGETYTGALRVSGESKGFSYGLEGAYQIGNALALAPGGADIRAFAVAGHVSKRFAEVALTPTVRLGASYASGDDGGGTYRQFDPLLPDVQRFHGQMDLFAWSNAMDLSARGQVVPWDDTLVTLEYRYARLAAASGEWVGSSLQSIGRRQPPPGSAPAGYAPLSGTPDPELGHELDVMFAWRPWVPLEFRAGYAGLLLGEGARGIMAARARGRVDEQGVVSPEKMAHYAFTQATLTMP